MTKFLSIYFSGTGNSRHVAELFSRNMDCECLSIEDDADFTAKISAADCISFTYPIYGSRVPFIMRQFIADVIPVLKNKKIAIFVTQVAFSGDGARVLCDILPENHVDVIYAEHFSMPNNISNFRLLRCVSDKQIAKRMKAAEAKMFKVCNNIREGVVRKRGFSGISRLAGRIQGVPWQGDSRSVQPAEGTMENRAKHSVKIDAECTVCNACIEICPMRNLEYKNGVIIHHNNCTICYRCVNLCPKQAITTFLHDKPKWQYKGIVVNEMEFIVKRGR